MRVLVVSNDRVGSAMAGPAIRSFQFAKYLARTHEVTLAVPYAADVDLPGVEIVARTDHGDRGFKRWAAGFDAVVAQRLNLRTMTYLAKKGTRTIYDLYVPFMIENLGLHGGEREDRGRRVLEYQLTNLLQETALALGDAFICASERQRDLWLGALGAIGRLDVAGYAKDPTLGELVAVVPFGLEPDPPQATSRVLKGVVPGIRESDTVLLWGGGIWNWFDPLTLIRAVARIAETRDDVKLFFLGVRHPNPLVEEMAMARRAQALAHELGVADRHVFFNTEWVPYDERHAYLLEADIGVSTHFDTVETRFSFRTRVLDYLWAGLPIVSTRGDVLSELVDACGLGETVAVGDVDGLAAAIVRLADAPEARTAASRRIAAVREELAWPRVVDRLAGFVEAPQVPRRAARLTVATLALHHLALATQAFAARGARGSVRDLSGVYRRTRRAKRVLART
jgi:glycosyltransferase involved in cell wall biosynthesis